jgi:hypothetical protein
MKGEGRGEEKGDGRRREMRGEEREEGRGEMMLLILFHHIKKI